MMALPELEASTCTVPCMDDYDIRTLATNGGLPVVDTPRHSIRSNSMDNDEVSESNCEMESKLIETGYDVESKSSSPVKIEQKIPRKHNQINLPPSLSPSFTGKLNPAQIDDKQLNLPLRPGAEECLFYIHTGWCGYGSACRYNHPQEKMAMYKPKAFNEQGLPLRDNVADCSFYMRTGVCRFGATCKFNHPQSVLDSTTASSQATITTPAVMSNQLPHHTLSSPDSIPVSTQSFVYQVPYPIVASSPVHSSPSSPRSKSVLSNISYLHPTTASPVGLVQATPMNVTTHHHIPASGYFVYYVPTTATIMSPERCWSHLNTGRCDLGSQCPYLH